LSAGPAIVKTAAGENAPPGFVWHLGGGLPVARVARPGVKTAESAPGRSGSWNAA
jgi:hypothetical protein